MNDLTAPLVALGGGLLGMVGGWVAAPLLVPEEPLFAEILRPILVPGGAAIGYLLSFVVGRMAMKMQASKQTTSENRSAS